MTSIPSVRSLINSALVSHQETEDKLLAAKAELDILAPPPPPGRGTEWFPATGATGNLHANTYAPWLDLYASIASLGGGISTSPDAKVWTSTSAPGSDGKDIHAVGYLELFIAVAKQTSSLYSADGVTWVSKNHATNGTDWHTVRGFDWLQKTFAFSQHGPVEVIGDPRVDNWQSVSAPTAGWQAAAGSEELNLIVSIAEFGGPPNGIYSEDGGVTFVGFTVEEPGQPQEEWKALTYDRANKLFIAFAWSGKIATTPDPRIQPFKNVPNIPAVNWGHGIESTDDGQTIAVTQQGHILESTDPLNTWNLIPNGGGELQDVVYSPQQGVFSVVGLSGGAQYSPDVSAPPPPPPPPPPPGGSHYTTGTLSVSAGSIRGPLSSLEDGVLHQVWDSGYVTISSPTYYRYTLPTPGTVSKAILYGSSDLGLIWNPNPATLTLEYSDDGVNWTPTGSAVHQNVPSLVAQVDNNTPGETHLHWRVKLEGVLNHYASEARFFP